MADQLNQLADLHNQGVLSDEEFAAAKAKLLGTLSVAGLRSAWTTAGDPARCRVP